jgi:hypothetical protein
MLSVEFNLKLHNETSSIFSNYQSLSLKKNSQYQHDFKLGYDQHQVQVLVFPILDILHFRFQLPLVALDFVCLFWTRVVAG